jgi:Pvc16 N-terminal domain
MSNALAISGVTAILQHYLTQTYSTAVGFPSAVNVSCLAPDQVKIGAAGSADVENQVNIFLHQVTHNAAWRNVDLASMSTDGTRRLQNPPLALNLHYLLTAYGSNDWQAEALLGYALMMLHEAPVLTRNDVSSALKALFGPPAVFPTNPLTPYLTGIGLADQIEMLKITPETLGREEMAWLWTALKADYRPTFPFLVSVVLMQPSLPSSQPLPVLRRVFAPQPMRVAQINQVQYVPTQMAAFPGDKVTVTGENLSGASQVSISNRYASLSPPPAIPPSSAQNGSVTFSLPLEGAQAYPAGVYDLAVQFLDPTGSYVQQTTNSLPFAVSPTLPTQTAATATVPGPVPGTTLLAVTVSGLAPPVYEGQDAMLSLSYIDTSSVTEPVVNRTAPAQPFSGKVTTLTFRMEPGLPTGKKLLGQLLVDGVSTQVQVTWLPFPPVFSGPWVTL